MSSRKQMLHRWWVGAVVILTALVVVALFFHESFTVGYYDYFMRLAWRRFTGNTAPSTMEVVVMRLHGVSPPEPEAMYLLCRGKLIQHGRLVNGRFLLQNIKRKGAAMNDFQDLARRSFPDTVDVGLTTNGRSYPLFLDVYDAPERMSAWEEFVTRYDVPE